MVDTRSLAFKRKVDGHIRSCLQGNGGVTAMVRQIDDFLSWENNYFRHSPKLAAKEYVMGGAFEVYTANAISDLIRWGYTQREVGRMSDPFETYADLVADGCVRLYKDYKAKHPVKKKAPAKRRV